jgi:hypothetical protein
VVTYSKRDQPCTNYATTIPGKPVEKAVVVVGRCSSLAVALVDRWSALEVLHDALHIRKRRVRWDGDK